MNLYHYYDRDIGPFKNISELCDEEAQLIMEQIAQRKNGAFCNQRSSDYLQKRRYYETILRKEFARKGGLIERQVPYYMVVEECQFLKSWYVNSASIMIPIDEFDPKTLSFTYGDSHPTFSDRVDDGREYRKKLYTYDEILALIDKYGYPQEWNPDGRYGPERYVEVHIWSDAVIRKYRE